MHAESVTLSVSVLELYVLILFLLFFNI
jgi:hypothetical protein